MAKNKPNRPLNQSFQQGCAHPRYTTFDNISIYALFDRKKTLPLLRGYGRFNRADLQRLIWSDYTPEEQNVFLGMMESCGICFKVRKLPNDEWEYLTPDLLPERSDVQEQLLSRLRDDPPGAEATARYPFLHDGILRNYLSKLGEHAKDAAIYWKYGCKFYEQKTRSQALIECDWDDPASKTGAGAIRLRAWGQGSNDIVTVLLQELEKLPIGHPPTITGYIRPAVHALAFSSASIPDLSEGPEISEPERRLQQLQFTARPEGLPPKGTPEIFISYAWGDDSSEISRKRGEVVERLCDKLGQKGWKIIRDKNAVRYGDLISGFMMRIGHADRVIVLLTDKYLRSPYCMTELYSIYQRSDGEKEDFLRHIVPLVFDDARFSTPEERVEYAEHWETRYKALTPKLAYLPDEDFRLYKAMQKWYLDIGEMLYYLNDVLTPHGFDEIVKDDFSALRKMLARDASI